MWSHEIEQEQTLLLPPVAGKATGAVVVQTSSNSTDKAAACTSPPDFVAPSGVSYAEADAFCTRHGARLCDAAELRGNPLESLTEPTEPAAFVWTASRSARVQNHSVVCSVKERVTMKVASVETGEGTVPACVTEADTSRRSIAGPELPLGVVCCADVANSVCRGSCELGCPADAVPSRRSGGSATKKSPWSWIR